MAQTPEGKVKDKLKKFCKTHNIVYYSINNQTGVVGFPDFVLTPPRHPQTGKGKHITVETKAPGGRLSPWQRRYKEMAEARNAPYMIYYGTEECDQKLIDLIYE